MLNLGHKGGYFPLWPSSVWFLWAIWAGSIIANAVWLLLDHSYFFYDAVYHFLDAVYVLNEPQRSSIVVRGAFWPPAVSMITAPIVFVTRYHVDLIILLMNSVFMAGLVWGAYRLGRLLADDLTGLLVALLTVLTPGIAGQSRTFMLDVPLTAVVTLFYACINDTQNLRRVLFSIGTGLLGAFGILTKPAFLFFAIGPWVYVFIAALRSQDRVVIRNVVLIPIIALALGLPWYLVRVGWFLTEYKQVQLAVASGYQQPHILSNFSIVYYVLAIWQAGSPLLAILSLAALPWFLSTIPRARFLFVAIFLPTYIALILTPLKAVRFVLPLMPVVALPIGALCARLLKGNRLWPKVMVSLCLLFFFVQFVSISFGIKYFPNGGVVGAGVRPEQRLLFWSQLYEISPHPDRVDWGIQQWFLDLKHRLEAVLSGDPREEKVIRIGVVTHTAVAEMLHFQSEMDRARNKARGPHLSFEGITENTSLMYYNFVISQTGGPEGPFLSSSLPRFTDLLKGSSHQFYPIDNRKLSFFYFDKALFTTWIKGGLLRVETVPATNATIVVNGIPRADWGLNWLELPPGEYTIDVDLHTSTATRPSAILMRHCAPICGQFVSIPIGLSVKVYPGVVTEVQIPFTSVGNGNGTSPKPTGTLHIWTDGVRKGDSPTIFIDGIPRNEVELWLTLPPGTVSVSFEDLGYETPTPCFSSGAPIEVEVRRGPVIHLRADYRDGTCTITP